MLDDLNLVVVALNLAPLKANSPFSATACTVSPKAGLSASKSDGWDTSPNGGFDRAFLAGGSGASHGGHTARLVQHYAPPTNSNRIVDKIGAPRASKSSSFDVLGRVSLREPRFLRGGNGLRCRSGVRGSGIPKVHLCRKARNTACPELADHVLVSNAEESGQKEAHHWLTVVIKRNPAPSLRLFEGRQALWGCFHKCYPSLARDVPAS